MHTSQGYDLNYTGLIFGEEIEYDEAKCGFRFNMRKFCDKNAKYLKATDAENHERVLSAYRVMLTRGIRGCYMYACNPGMQKFLKKWFPSASGSA